MVFRRAAELPMTLFAAPDSLFALFGAIAQLGERLLCKQEVVGSIPSGSTRHRCSALDATRAAQRLRRRGVAPLVQKNKTIRVVASGPARGV